MIQVSYFDHESINLAKHLTSCFRCFSLTTPRGILIAFEGGDKSGKSTQSRHLSYLLNTVGKESKLIKFPDRTSDSGLVIDMYLKGKVDFEPLHLHRLFSRNRQEQKDKILNLLNSGVNVIVDRYVHSGVAYTAARLDQMSPLFFYEDRGLPRPDLTFFLYLTGKELESRLPPHPETGESRVFPRGSISTLPPSLGFNLSNA